jgi:hypothetical protein
MTDRGARDLFLAKAYDLSLLITVLSEGRT